MNKMNHYDIQKLILHKPHFSKHAHADNHTAHTQKHTLQGVLDVPDWKVKGSLGGLVQFPSQAVTMTV